jgi:hypothetical protein
MNLVSIEQEELKQL